jgi:hypothetical protein
MCKWNNRSYSKQISSSYLATLSITRMRWNLLVESILFFLYLGWAGMKRIAQMGKLLQVDYPKKESFLYLWFVGTLP